MAKGQRSNREIRKPKAAKAKRPLEVASHDVPAAALAKARGVGGRGAGSRKNRHA
jgi:hypothetical protein